MRRDSRVTRNSDSPIDGTMAIRNSRAPENGTMHRHKVYLTKGYVLYSATPYGWWCCYGSKWMRGHLNSLLYKPVEEFTA